MGLDVYFEWDGTPAESQPPDWDNRYTWKSQLLNALLAFGGEVDEICDYCPKGTRTDWCYDPHGVRPVDFKAFRSHIQGFLDEHPNARLYVDFWERNPTAYLNFNI